MFVFVLRVDMFDREGRFDDDEDDRVGRRSDVYWNAADAAAAG